MPDTEKNPPPPRPTSKSSTPRHPLPTDLQKIVDKSDSDSVFEQIYDGNAAESTDTSLRYAAYGSRLRTILVSAHRYVAYTSDVGESFRPVAHPGLIRTAYGISWAYLVGDVGHEGYKAYLRNQRVLHPGVPGVISGEASSAVAVGKEAVPTKSALTGLLTGEGAATEEARPPTASPLSPGKVPLVEDWRAVMAQRAVFQGLASMGLPAFTIHSIVRYSGRALKDVKNVKVRTYGPIGLGLAAVPFLPFVFDKPVEEATEWVFHKAFEVVGGEGAVGHKPEKVKEKEL